MLPALRLPIAGFLLWTVACSLGSSFVNANSYLHPNLPNHHQDLARTHRTHEGGRSLRRSLLQSSSSAPQGATTPDGLLIYTPVDVNRLDPDDFASFFFDAYNDDSTIGIYLTPGSYQVQSQYDYTQTAWQFYMGCTANSGRATSFEVNMEGTNLFMGSRNQGGFAWNQCSNLYWHGVNMTYGAGELPFTQGTIRRIGSTNWTIQIDQGYPGDEILLNNQGHLCSLYDTRGNLVQNASEVYAGVFSSNGNGSYTFQMGYTIPAVRVGMRLAIRGDTPASHMNFMNNCNNFRGANMAIYQSNIFAIEDNGGRNSTYDRITIIPDPRGVPGTTQPPLFSTNADGIHVTLPPYGPTIRDCYLSNTGDDGLAAHGVYEMVAQIVPSRRVVTVAYWSCQDVSCLPIAVGDSLLMYSSQVRNLGAATVRSIVPASNPKTVIGTSPNAPAFNFDTASYFNLTFNSLPSLWTSAGGPNGYVTVPATTGNFAVITGNYVANNRARGIFTKCQNSQINNNRIIGSGAVGLLLSTDTYFLESDFQYNTTVTGNFINVTGAGIILSAFNASNQPGVYSNHRIVNMALNTIQGSMHPLTIGAATRVNCTYNSFIDGACYPSIYNDFLYNQATPGSLVYASYTTSSTFAYNLFRNNRAECRRYGNYQTPYQTGPGNTNTSFRRCTTSGLPQPNSVLC